MRRINTTADELALAIWGAPASELIPDQTDVSPRGTIVYRGTSIPVRRVPGDAQVTLVADCGGGHVEAECWIADRFGRLGAREASRALRRIG